MKTEPRAGSSKRVSITTSEEVPLLRLMVSYIDLSLQIHSNPSGKKFKELKEHIRNIKADIRKNLGRRILNHG